MPSKKKTSSQVALRLKKVPVSALLEPEQAQALKKLSEKTRVRQQEYIREGVDHVLAKYRAGK